MLKYLTQEWFDEFVTLAQDQPARAGATVNVQYHVAGAPEGDLEYYWVVDEGKVVEAKIGSISDPDFVIKMSYEDSARMQQGELDAAFAFMRGKMKVSGNMAKMMKLMPIQKAPEWKALQEKVRLITEY